MRSRIGLFASTVALAFASVGAIAVAGGSHGGHGTPKPPTVSTYEINTTASKIVKTWHLFFLIPYFTLDKVEVSVEDQCKAQLDKIDHNTTVQINWGPGKEYCWVTVTETTRR